jgi:hypothetical protein
MCLTLAAVHLPSIASSAEPAPHWYVTTQTFNEIDSTLELDLRSTTLKLNQGWTCLVSGLTERSTHSSRETTCSNEGKEIAFTVECNLSQPSDHVQIRFKDKNGRPVDFIEVGCKAKA